MAGIKRQSNGEAKPVGPHPSTIRVSRPYMTQNAIDKQLQAPPTSADIQDKSQLEAREDNIRLQGVSWLDNTRRALQLPIRTFTTACVYYHKFRLAHPGVEFNWVDAAAASLLTSCKVEDTLKKSKDILAAAYNVKMGPHEQVGSDDVMFEAPGRVVIGLERLILESGAFDFRSRYPHQLLVKIVRDTLKNDISESEAQKTGRIAYTILTDLHRTFAPLKQTTSTMAITALELAAHLIASTSENETSKVRDFIQSLDLKTWSTTREEMMETLLDALDLYTHHTTSTILGQKFGLEDFLKIRLAFNKECNETSIPRYTTAPEPSPDQPTTTSATLRVSNGHPTPVSPPQPGGLPMTTVATSSNPKDETLRFMLNPALAADEKQTVQKYFIEEWEEYEEEIEVPIPATTPARPRSRSPPPPPPPPPRAVLAATSHRHHALDRRDLDDRRPPAIREERDRHRLREHDVDRERVRIRDRERERERERRYDDRRYDDRRYDDRRRYEDRRGGRY